MSASTPAPSKRTPAPAEGQEIVLIGGMPAGGKTTVTEQYTARGYERLNRDSLGGSVDDLLRPLNELVLAGKSAVLDNLYATRASRAAVLKLAKERKIPIRFVHVSTSMEEAMFNACLRMMDRCKKVLHPEHHKEKPYRDDPGLFPVAVFYKYRKEFEKPATSEGFAAVEDVPFERRFPTAWKHKAAIFDFDGTLRTHEGKEKYPLKASEVRAYTDRAAKIRDLEKQGYLLLGASNQSGVAKGTLTAADVEACLDETLRQLGVKFGQVLYCPHKVPPISCYCRKPNPGMGAELIVRYNLDPRQSVYVGDAGTDKSFAQRCGFQFTHEGEFFKS